jgi:hypothetical protein
LAQPPRDPAHALQAALSQHDASRRAAFAGVTASDLDTEKRLWSEIGDAIASLARLVADGCDASVFCTERPATSALCARLVEAIDDRIDLAAWTVIEAAAQASLFR